MFFRVLLGDLINVPNITFQAKQIDESFIKQLLDSCELNISIHIESSMISSARCKQPVSFCGHGSLNVRKRFYAIDTTM